MRYRFTYEVRVVDPSSTLCGKRYFGKHTTANLGDGYVGSSRAVRDYVRAHGRDGVERRILRVFFDDATLARAERELVERMMSELGDDCLNRRRSSAGGFATANESRRLLSAEERSRYARKAALAKRICPAEVRQSWSRHCRAAHARMSPEEKARRYGRVSESLGRYYATPEGRDEFAERRLANVESNRRTARRWRSEFAALFGASPESFRRLGKMKAALDLFKAAQQDKENMKDEIARFVESACGRG